MSDDTLERLTRVMDERKQMVLEALETCRKANEAAAQFKAERDQLLAFVSEFLDPEGYGRAVNSEIRNHARRLLGSKERE